MTAPLPDQSAEKQAPQMPSDARRRLLKGSLAAGPVILTVTSTPVLGATQCRSLSSGLSGNLSQPGRGVVSCDGLTSLQWKNSINTRTKTFTAAATTPQCLCTHKFSDYFAGGPTHSLKTILDGLTTNSNDFKAHLVGALLNIRAGKIPVAAMDENKLKGLWAEIKTNGYYQPFGSAQKRWNAAQVVSFLRNNGIA